MSDNPDPRSTAAHLHTCEGCKDCAQHWKARALKAEEALERITRIQNDNDSWEDAVWAAVGIAEGALK